MSKYIIDDTSLEDIADAIREYGSPDDSEKKLKTSEMREGILNVYNHAESQGYNAGDAQGYQRGKTEGYSEGESVGYKRGEEAGKKTEALAYWNAIMNDGTRTQWDQYSPFNGADFGNIKFPKPLVVQGNCRDFFRLYCGKQLPRKQDIDMSRVTSAQAAFSYMYPAETEYVPDYGIPALDSYLSMYDTSYYLKTIETIRCHEDTTFLGAFQGCSKLANITFEGVIGQNMNLSWSPLTIATLKNLISHLKDYTGINEYGYTLTLKSSAFSVLEEEGATAEYNGVACTWRELIDNKKWNLTLK